MENIVGGKNENKPTGPNFSNDHGRSARNYVPFKNLLSEFSEVGLKPSLYNF